MQFKEMIIGLGIFLCFSSAVLLASIQLRKAAKSSIFASVFESLGKQEISKAKFSGALFLAGALLVIIGIAQ